MNTASFVERSGKAYVIAEALKARQSAWEVLEKIAAKIQPGMTEEDAIALSRELYAADGVEKHWHKPVVRFGKNTVKSFSEPFDFSVKLQHGDLFFLDYGPVYKDLEADVGKTFLLGKDPCKQRCMHDSQELWKNMQQIWMKENCTGRDLYEFGVTQAKGLGWEFKLEGASGHRIADFPHHAYYKGSMKDLPFTPSSHLWVLEVQLIAPDRSFGAFYEDLLI